jgi:hypothetical protein
MLIGWLSDGSSQERDSLPAPARLNVISFNPTPMMVCNSLRNITLVYERVVKPNQTMVFQLGYLEFRSTLGDSLPQITTFSMNSSAGVNASFHYRFYLKHLNTHPAPFGLYIGPYSSYYGLKFKSNYSLKLSDPVQSERVTTTYNLFNLGFGLGYQFIIKERLSLDVLFFGPSLTYEVKDRQSEGNVPENEQSAISKLLDESYSWQYPLFNKFIGEHGNKSEAYLTTFFRYSFTIGYHF